MSKEMTVIDYTNKEIIQTLVATVAQGLNPQEFALFAEHCKGTGLNPFKKEVWAIKAGGRLQIMTGNQGFHTIANSHPQYDGMETGFVGKAGEYLPMTYPANDFIGSWAKVYRKDRRIPLEAVAMLAEYDKGQSNWKTMRRIMIVKCAESLALRKAFPQELNGLYSAEEMPADYSQVVVEEVKPTVLASLKTADQLQAEKLPAHKQLVGFGKHKDKPWEELSNEYLQWLVDKADNEKRMRALGEIDRRCNVDEVFNGDDIPDFGEHDDAGDRAA